LKSAFLCSLLFLCLLSVSWAKDVYNIEVLQVSNIELFERAYQGFKAELVKEGIVAVIHRRIIDADADETLWKRVSVLYQIRKEADEIIVAKPDLILTISTPATKYTKDKFLEAGIPVVFTAVANPLEVGCDSLEYSGKGFTGSTLYVDPFVLLSLSRVAMPSLTKIGMVHSDDDNAVAFVKEAREKGSKLGITVLTEQVEKSDPINPAAQRLIDQGVQAFGVPLDTYYGLKEDKAGHELINLASEKNIPIFAFMNYNIKGGILYMGSDFSTVGSYSGKQAAQILKEGIQPRKVPIYRQEEPVIFSDMESVKRLGIVFPVDLQKALQPVDLH
jgi:putative tryptophan/tyrosine transport system substrate-binding protein